LKIDQPIGVFDSGIGGLTVAKALVEALPNESIVYFGDTVHLPYGDKSPHTIKNYTKEIVNFLLAQNVKLILIACNSASAAAYEVLQDYIGTHTLLINVIDPVICFLSKNYSHKRIGLIGTKLTIDSEVYRKKLVSQEREIDLCALATPLLVPIIEEGFFEHRIIDVALSLYLSNPVLQDIEALVLGCTHYPIIKTKIENFYRNKVEVIDTTKIVASAVEHKLTAKKLLSSSLPQHSFYVSDYTANFAHQTRLFFGEEVAVKALEIF
jgi:glutamate racemase